MEYRKFIDLVNRIRDNYNFLPLDLKKEINDMLVYYKDLVIISKVERSNYECC